MAIRPARRITDTSPKNFGMFAKAVGMPGDLIHLELGMPADDTPQHIKDATIAALQNGHVHYSDLQGLSELRQALSHKLKRQNAIDVTADEILITNGLTQGSFAAFMGFLDAGDEALLLAPYYPQHIGKAELAGAKATIAPLDATNGFSINRALIEPVITSATRVIVLVNPCNPTGRVYSLDELQIIADLAREYDLLVISDEVYEEITYDTPHISIASLPGMKERTITLFAFTKAYAMDGWRLGYVAAAEALMPPLMKITTNDATHVNTFIQYGALAAVTGDSSVLATLVARDRERRDYVVGRLNQMPGVTCADVQGAIYVFPDITATGLHAQECADRLLRDTGVVVEAGSFYGTAGEGHLRVCFGCAELEVLADAMDRMQRFFNSL
ncbi:MAG: aminotransferase class I/II-fold pyridoxal phosphate-dependent enzyme [Sulfitobacter sp.]